MLDVCLEDRLSEEAPPVDWRSIPARAEVPHEVDGFFGREGPTLPSFNEQRALHRFHLREQAVLCVNGDYFAGYSRDASRSGVGLITPVQLFPLSEITAWVEGRGRLDLRVVRCQRLDKYCYACGTVFVKD